MTVYNKNRILVYNDVLCGWSLNFKLSLLDEIKNRQSSFNMGQNDFGWTGGGSKQPGSNWWWGKTTDNRHKQLAAPGAFTALNWVLNTTQAGRDDQGWGWGILGFLLTDAL